VRILHASQNIRSSQQCHEKSVTVELAFALFLGVEGLSGPPVRAAKEEPPAEV